MADKVFSFTSLFYFFLVRFLFRRLKTTSQTSSHKKAAAAASSNLNVHSSAHIKLLKYPSTTHSSSPSPSSTQTILFDVEATLFKSSSLFPYFMLVAFEAGSLFRALILLLIYPFVCLIKEDKGIELMVMVCFCGIKKDSFRVGRAVLPKFFLEDVGMEGFQGLMMMSGGRKVGVSRLPRVMVEGFLREYLEIEVVVARELKVFKGYYLGLMEPIDDNMPTSIIDSDHVIGIAGFNKPIAHLFSFCKEIYLVSDAEKKSWHYLPKEKYPKPLIFHDGRLALRPTLDATLAIFMWFPFGVFLAVIRALVYLSLPPKIRNPILAFTGFRLEITKPADSCSTDPSGKSKGVLYVCNHRTLLDPLYLSAALLNNKPITAVTYSLSRVSELLAPIKTVRLTRDKQQDAKLMDTLLRQGDVVICPEGTTCREPYLLRLSPLFAEMGDEIVPVALDAHVSMFHGTTAGGLKCLDPVFFAMNPYPSYKVKVLEKVYGMASRSAAADDAADDDARFKIANHVQRELAKALGFECTKLTRKDKYLMLAGNEGIVSKI